MSELISIKDAVARGIERVRRPIWANQKDHLKIDIINGRMGPWLHLYCPFNMECNKRDPVDMFFVSVDVDAKEWEPYAGPLADSDEYKAEVAAYIADGKRLQQQSSEGAGHE